MYGRCFFNFQGGGEVMSLTKKQKQVYDFIVDYIDRYGVSPTQLEIKEHFGFKSLGSVQDYIRYLKNLGHLQGDANSVRGLMPIEHDDDYPSRIDLSQIPLFGQVAAGKPIEALESTDLIEVPKEMLVEGHEHFALTVNGQSMIEDGILSGDVIVVKKQNHAVNGETIVATINNEATVKRYYKKHAFIELHPANNSMSPIIVQNGDFQIKGVLVGLLRKY
jgi:repressor LexA